MINKQKSEELFPDEEKVRQIKIIVVAEDDTLLTRETFNEMIQFENILYSITEYADTKLDALNDI